MNSNISVGHASHSYPLAQFCLSLVPSLYKLHRVTSVFLKDKSTALFQNPEGFLPSLTAVLRVLQRFFCPSGQRNILFYEQ